jgi:hypothetical protein
VTGCSTGGSQPAAAGKPASHAPPRASGPASAGGGTASTGQFCSLEDAAVSGYALKKRAALMQRVIQGDSTAAAEFKRTSDTANQKLLAAAPQQIRPDLQTLAQASDVIIDAMSKAHGGDIASQMPGNAKAKLLAAQPASKRMVAYVKRICGIHVAGLMPGAGQP